MKDVLVRMCHILLGRNVYVIRKGMAKGLKRKGGIGFLPGKPSIEDEFLTGLDLRGKTIYDIGAYVGLFAIFFARAAGKEGRVIAFEPNPESYKEMLENVRINGFDNIDTHNIAIGKERSEAILGFNRAFAAKGSIEKYLMADEKKGILFRTITVPVDSIDRLLSEGLMPEPDFVKIDVEGLEADVLSGMDNTIDRYKPELYIELHGSGAERKDENTVRVIGLLRKKGYDIYHVESSSRIPEYEKIPINEGHIYCSAKKGGSV